MMFGFFWSLHGIVLPRPPDFHTDGHMPSPEPRKQSSKANLASLAGVVRADRGRMSRLEQRGGGTIAFMAAALWIMLLIAAWEYLF
jgi:hypothetical protein